MMFVLGDSGASAKPAQDEPRLYSTQFLLTAGSPPPHWSPYSHFCDCWSEVIWVQSATSHKQTNKQTNLAAIPVRDSHTPPIICLLFLPLCFW